MKECYQTFGIFANMASPYVISMSSDIKTYLQIHKHALLITNKYLICLSLHRYSVVNQLITTDLDVIEEEDSDFTDSDISDLQSYTGKLLHNFHSFNDDKRPIPE